MIKRLHTCDIKDHDNSVSSTVVSRSDGAKSFLSRRVPNLKLYRLVFNFDSAETKVDTNGGNVTLGKGVILPSLYTDKQRTNLDKSIVLDDTATKRTYSKSQQQTRFSNTTVTD
jgi:hypothetical protein